MICDPVYEGKSMAGLVGLVGDGTIPADATVLYVHLGGAPALNAYSALFRCVRDASPRGAAGAERTRPRRRPSGQRAWTSRARQG